MLWQTHTINGASANVGGQALHDIAFEMEQLGKAGNLKAITNKISDLEIEFDRLKEAIVEYLDGWNKLS